MTLAVHAMKVEVHDSAVYATGPVEDDLLKFQEALAQSNVQTVVLVNSPGGDLWTGMRVGRLIAEKGLNTVVAGYCASACSIMFMGGKERSFSDTFRPEQTYVGIHGPHNKTTKAVNPQAAGQIFAFLKQNMGERFNADIMNMALYNMEDSGSMLRVFDPIRLPKRVTYHCKSVQSPRNECTDFKDQDAWTLGVVTSRAFTKVALPAGFTAAPKLFAQELSQPIADTAEFFKDLAVRQCVTDICRKLITDFVANKENKALAIPLGMTGLGTVSNRESPTNAFVSAIYACNHVKDKPARLCETLTVNGYDVRAIYPTGAADHAHALLRLTVPENKFYGNEEFGGGFTSASGLRTQKWNDITPQKLDRIKTIATQELALALKSEQPPLVIDVLSGANDAIPGALTLLHGGLAFDDAKDIAFEARFAALLKLLSPDPTKPVVFYCAGRDMWLSVNAAMRAEKLGYTQVGWYRGGLLSWKAANLPVAPVLVRAAVL